MKVVGYSDEKNSSRKQKIAKKWNEGGGKETIEYLTFFMFFFNSSITVPQNVSLPTNWLCPKNDLLSLALAAVDVVAITINCTCRRKWSEGKSAK